MSAKIRPRAPAGVDPDLVDVLYASPTALMTGGATILFVAGWACRDDPQGPLGPPFAACLAAFALRVAASLAHAAAGPDRRPGTWLGLYAATAWGFAAAFGWFLHAAAGLSPASPWTMPLCAIALGYAGAMAGRNAAYPLVVLGQFLLLCGPMAAGLLAHGGPPERVLAFLCLPFMAGLGRVSWSMRDTLVRALEGTRAAAAAAAELDLQNARMQAALAHIGHGVVMFDPQGRVAVANAEFAAMHARDPAPAQGTSAAELMSRSLADPAQAASEAGRVAARAEGVRLIELPDGRCLSSRVRRIPDGGTVLTHQDVTERVREGRLAEHLARHDPLTGLPNRRALEEALARPGTGYLMYLDLDRFKPVNDHHGHAAGDAILRAVAGRLAAEAGGALAARIGGDEFALVFRGTREAADAAAGRIVAALARPFPIDGALVTIGASVGLAALDGSPAGALLDRADRALYAAKSAGRDTHRFADGIGATLAA